MHESRARVNQQKPHEYTHLATPRDPLGCCCQAHRLEPCLTPRDRRFGDEDQASFAFALRECSEWKIGIARRRTHLSLGFERSSLTCVRAFGRRRTERLRSVDSQRGSRGVAS